MDIAQILACLEQLQENNNKPWMDMHKPAYQQARNTVLAIADCLIKGLTTSEPALGQLLPKDCVFRINRDIRFSKDKTPYKSYMGLYIAQGGKKSDYAGYYLHIAPHDQSFIAGGLYQPEPAVLKQVRQEIDYNAVALSNILDEPRFKKLFGDLQGEKLQRAPKDYPTHHPHIEWLKLKSFTALHLLTDSKVIQPGFVDHTLATFQALQPLNQFLNTALEH